MCFSVASFSQSFCTFSAAKLNSSKIYLEAQQEQLAKQNGLWFIYLNGTNSTPTAVNAAPGWRGGRQVDETKVAAEAFETECCRIWK